MGRQVEARRGPWRLFSDLKQGPNHDDPELKGLIPRMMEGLFEKIQAFDESFEFAIKCSYIEIYNEKIMDLLDPSKNKL